jgi:hypothetical protein
MRDAQEEDCDRFQPVQPEMILGSLDSDEAKVAWEHAATCVQCQDALQKNAGWVGQALLT